MKQNGSSPVQHHGFTLIEMMIVVAIIGVLVAIAYPSYIQYKIRTTRVEVQADMMNIAQRLHLYKQINNSYSGVVLTNTGVYGGSVFPQVGNVSYALTLAVDADNQGWTLTANPDGRGVATNSIQKGTGAVVLNDQGQKCWTKTTTTCTPSALSNWNGR